MESDARLVESVLVSECDDKLLLNANIQVVAGF